MKLGKTLVELAETLQRDAADKRDLIADARQITLTPDSRLSVDGEAHEPTDHCHRQIATWTGIGTRYYEKMRDDSPALLAGNVNHWLHKEPEKQPTRRMVRTLRGKARAFLSDRYLRLDNEHIAEATMRALEAAGTEVEIASCDVTDRHLYIKALFPRIEGEVRVGDTIQAGISVRNNEIGGGSLEVFPFTRRLICLNGMTVQTRTGGYKRRHLGARVQSDGVIYQQDTITAASQAALLQCRDAVTTFADPAYFEGQLQQMREATEGPRVERPAKAVEVLAKAVGLTGDESDSILERLIREQDYSRWGMLNAVTNLANDVESYDRASELENIGGQILTMQLRDWQRVAVAA